MTSSFPIFFVSLFRMITSTCFESSFSSTPRRVITTEMQWTYAACRLSCSSNSQCLAVRFTASTRKCFILGETVTDGSQCDEEYIHFVKKPSCSAGISPPLTPSTDYSSTGCQDAEDVSEIPVNATNPCGNGTTPSGKLAYIVEVVLNDGTRAFYPNQRSRINWDPEIGTYKHTYKDLSQFISFARCMRVPQTLSAACECGPIPLTGPQSTQTQEISPYIKKRPSCPSGYTLWAHYLFETKTQPEATPSISTRSVFCIEETWFMWYVASYEETTMVRAASCLRVPPLTG